MEIYRAHPSRSKRECYPLGISRNQESVASILSQDRENDREREIFSSSGQIYSTSQTLKLTLSTCHDNLPLINANIDFLGYF